LKPDHPDWFDYRLREIDMFFAGNDRVHETMRRVAQKLEDAKIPYAVLGGMAVNAHGHERTTKDVDFLLTAEGLSAFRKRIVGHPFKEVAGRPRRFLDPDTEVTFDVLVTGMFPGAGRPGPVAFPDPEAVGEIKKGSQVVNLRTLIQLKLAARRHQDFADVVNLVRVHQLDETYVPLLDPSVHRDFIECLEEKRREDEYESRQDEEVERRGLGHRDSGEPSPPPS
jgi:hypothetical protein